MSSRSGWTVIVVGGAGSMGRYAVRSIAQLGSAARLLIADQNIEFAQRLAEEIGEPCEAVALDATDEAALRKAFADCDVVCSTLGPFSLFGGPIMRAAVDMGCHYLDIDDDWQSTVQSFELDEQAAIKDVTAIVGIGSSPGLSNMLALRAAADLDEVDALYTGWRISAAVTEEEPDYPPTGSTSAAVEHWLLQCSGKIRAWDNGGYVDVEPVQKLVLDLPGIGERAVYTMGHPEPITLPRAVPGLRRSFNVQSGPDWLLEYVRSVAADLDAGRITLQEGARKLEDPPRPEREPERPPGPRLPYNWALAQGVKDGRPLAVMTFPNGEPAGRMGGHTGVPLAIGVELLRLGKIKGKGVQSPEMAIDPDDFLEMYADFLEPPAANAESAISRVEGGFTVTDR